ncbi:MAG: hypothetical protein QOK43_821 [Acidimicrobiaceae bacterium]|nr:hypothetical protein [Acidimicrobiaceae bacterium]
MTTAPTAFTDLLATPGVEEIVELRSAFGFMAFHGGSLERMTDVIAADAAARAGASLYAVLQPADLRWHIPSHHVDGSEGLAAFLGHVDVAIALHGFGREGYWHRVLVGGSNRALAEHVASHLRAGLDHLDIVSDLALIPRTLQGMHKDNPVNRTAAGGVQIELPPRARGLTPHRYPIEPLVEALAAAAESWPAYSGSPSTARSTSPSPSISKVPPARQ